MGDFKLIERYEDGRVHLYNIQQDIGEQTDLAKQRPDMVDTMRSKLHGWYQEVGAKFLQAKPGQDEQPWTPDSQQ